MIGDLVQLQIDVEVYNDQNPAQPPIRLVLDFKNNVDERRAG